MTGRLHTCYSPVRRSPAERTEVLSPLPLDLHVLSLSLAFILSQDQTLRCLLYCSFFSFEIMRTKIFVFVLLLNNPERFRRARRLRSVRPGTTLDLLSFKEIDLGHSLFNDSCTVSLSIANISMFSAAFVCRNVLQSYEQFLNYQNFSELFSKLFRFYFLNSFRSSSVSQKRVQS